MSTVRRLSSYELLRIAEVAGSLGVWTFEVVAANLTWSTGLYRLLGLQGTEEPSFPFFEGLVHPEDRAPVADPLRWLSEGAVPDRSFRLIGRDGRLRHMHASHEILHGSDGRPTGVMGIVRDVTELEAARARAALMERRIDVLTNLLGVDHWTAGPDGTAFGSEPLRRKTGLDCDADDGWGRLAAVHPEDRPLVRKAWDRALSGGDRYDAVYRLRTPCGGYRAVHSRGAPVRGPDGRIAWWVGVCADAALSPTGRSGAGTLDRSQLRAARSLLGWSIEDLARASGLSVSTLRRMESDGQEKASPATVDAIVACLAAEGVVMERDPLGNVAVYRTAVTVAEGGRED